MLFEWWHWAEAEPVTSLLFFQWSQKQIYIWFCHCIQRETKQGGPLSPAYFPLVNFAIDAFQKDHSVFFSKNTLSSNFVIFPIFLQTSQLRWKRYFHEILSLDAIYTASLPILIEKSGFLPKKMQLFFQKTQLFFKKPKFLTHSYLRIRTISVEFYGKNSMTITFKVKIVQTHSARTLGN